MQYLILKPYSFRILKVFNANVAAIFPSHIGTNTFSFDIALSKFVHCLLHVLGNAIPSFGLILIENVFILCVLASVHLTKNATQQFLEYFRNSSTLILVSFAFNFLDTIESDLKLCE